MPTELSLQPDPDQPLVYQIRVKSHLGLNWSDWFEGMMVTQDEGGDTVLTGPVMDQAALHGLLKKVRDLGLPLISVIRLESCRSTTLPERKPGLHETGIEAAADARE